MKQPITTVDDLIDALGGTKNVALWAKVDPSAVSHWRRLEKIPRGWHLPLYALCAERQLCIDCKELFGVQMLLRAA